MLTDPDMDDLHNDVIGVWVRLGVMVKVHGNKGRLTISKEQFKKRLHLQKIADNDLENLIKNLAKINVKVVLLRNDLFGVTFKKWHKYQVDDSAKRVSDWRENNPKNVTPQEKEEEKEEEKEKKKNKNTPLNPPKGNGVFKRPSLDEVTTYCNERNKGIDPKAFMDHYDANGWMVGKSKMKDWKASVRTWEHNRKQPFQPEITYPDDKKDWI